MFSFLIFSFSLWLCSFLQEFVFYNLCEVKGNPGNRNDEDENEKMTKNWLWLFCFVFFCCISLHRFLFLRWMSWEKETKNDKKGMENGKGGWIGKRKLKMRKIGMENAKGGWITQRTLFDWSELLCCKDVYQRSIAADIWKEVYELLTDGYGLGLDSSREANCWIGCWVGIAELYPTSLLNITNLLWRA